MFRPLVILAGVLAFAVAGVYGWRLLSLDRPPSADDLARAALQANSAEERELAAVGLSQLGKPAREHIVRVCTESSDPEVRAACLRGLADQWAYRQMPLLLDALDDESPLVRAQAGEAVQLLLKVDNVNYHFDAGAPPPERQKMVKRLRGRWKEFPESKVRMAFIRQQEGEDYP
jgi:hypothetical protein